MSGTRTANNKRSTRSPASQTFSSSVTSFRAAVGYDPVTGLIDQSRLQDGYQWILRDIQERNKIQQSNGTTSEWSPEWVFWVTEAQRINAGGDSASSEFIRLYNVVNGGGGFLPTENQAVSDKIATSILTYIAANGKYPTLDHIINFDAGVAVRQFNNGFAGWGGAFYYWDVPVYDLDLDANGNPTGSFKIVYEAGSTSDVLTLGESILRDPEQLERFASNIATTLTQMDDFTRFIQIVWAGGPPGPTTPIIGLDAEQVEGGIAVLRALNKLPKNLRDDIFARLDASGSPIPEANEAFVTLERILQNIALAGLPYMTLLGAELPEELRSQILDKYLDDLEQKLLASEGIESATDESHISQRPDALERFLKEFGNTVGLGVQFIDGGQLGLALGSALGRRITNNAVGQIAASATLKTTLGALGELIDTEIFNTPRTIRINGEEVSNPELTTNFLANGLEGFFNALGQNFVNAGVGALSSYLTAELVKAIGLQGIPGEIASSVGGAVVNQIVSNIVSTFELFGAEAADGVFAGINGPLLVSAAASYVGSKLASEIYSPRNVGGQIGSAVGSAYGSLVATAILATGLNPVTIAAAVVAVIFWQTVGALVGSIFGGTPRSGADAQWDSGQQQFTVTNVYARKGGSKDEARSLAGTAANNFNSVLAATGATILDPTGIQTGNYGKRENTYVYRPISTQDKSAISAKFRGEHAAQNLINHGTYLGLSDMVLQLAGGDIYVKRALKSALEYAGGNPTINAAGAAGNFSMETLVGDLAVARDYSAFLDNREAIGALISAAAESTFAAGWLITLARAAELGLNKRAATDWTGGYVAFLDEVEDGIVDGKAVSAVQMVASINDKTGERSWSLFNANGKYVGSSGDSILPGDQTVIQTANNDVISQTIDLRSSTVADQTGLMVNGHLNDDIAKASEDFADLSSVSHDISAGATRSLLMINTVADVHEEVTEQFRVSLGDGIGSLLIDNDAKVMIVDASDAAYLQVGRSYAAESDSYLVWRVSLSKVLNTGESLSIDLGLVSDRAESGADYLDSLEFSASPHGGWSSASALTFDGSTTEFYVRVAVVADNVSNPEYSPINLDPEGNLIAGSGNGEPEFLNIEGNERLVLTANITAGASYISNGNANIFGVGTIVDGASPDPLVWLDDTVVHEGSPALISLARSRVTSFASHVNFGTSDNRLLQIAVAATVNAGGGDDTIYASNRGDNIFGGEGNDTLYGGRLDDWLLGNAGNDTLDAGTLDSAALGGDGNYLNGGDGNDILRGREGSDWLEGGDGADTLTGGGGDDILAAGAGAGDSSKGGVGDDQYLVRLGDGEDIAEDEATGAPVDGGAGDAITQRYAGITAGTILKNWVGSSVAIQQQKLAGGEDAMVFGYGISIGDIQLVRSTAAGGGNGNDLIVRIMQTVEDVNGVLVESYSGTSLTVKDWFTDPFKRIEWLKFADGNEIRIGDITSFIIGGEGNDVLVGTQGNDFVYGGSGDDELFLLGGDDIGNGGLGDDMVSGDAGRDLVIGGIGADELLGGAGSDAISGDDGADDIYGGADRDLLSGGRGDGDQVVGGGGDDTFKFARGDGKDTYFDDYSNNWDIVWTASGQWNAALGYSYNDITGEVTGPGGALIRKNFGTVASPDIRWVGRFDYDSAAQTLKLFNPPAGAATTVSNNGIDTIEFAPGINLQDVILRRVGNDLVMAVSNDELETAASSAVSDSVTIKDWYVAPGGIEKLAFYETGILDISASATNLVAGTDGTDGTTTTPLAGTTLADWITGGAGDDVIAGGSGKDILAGNSGSDTLRGETDDDVLYGGTGNDILDGGAGKDVLVGGNGIDTASYASSTGATRIRLSFESNNTANALGDEFYSIENILGGSAADNIGGDAYENELEGAGGQDTLMGGAGDDTYVWNTTSGSDTIREGAFVVEEVVTTTGTLAAGYTTTWTNTGTPSASNKFYWRLEVRGPGNELVYDYALYSYGANSAMPAPTAWNVAGWLGGFAKTNGNQVTRDKFETTISGGDNDTIEFGAGISLSDLTFIRATAGAPDAAGLDLIVRYVSSETQITIKDHFTVSGKIETIQFRDGLAVSLASILSATSTAALNGTANDDLIVGQTGTLNDLLYGGDGSDALSGMAGVDQLYGEAGDDILEGGAGADRLDGGANAVDGFGDTVRYIKSAAVTVDLQVTTAQTGGDAGGDTLFGIENVVGSQAGNDTITGNADANRIDALDGNNTINGKAGDDVLISGAGSDTIYGDLGEDNISSGDGNDQLWGGDGDDVLFAGVGDDQLRGDAGNDQLLGGEGNDSVLDGGIGNDDIYGDAGDDNLTGGDGNDTLGGGSGSDSLQGGLGDDVYFVQSNDGADTITDTSGTNVISFDTGITNDRIWLTQAGSDLKIGVIGENTVLTVTGFFGGATPSLVKSIQTATHAIFLDHPDTLNLIAAMTAASATTPTVLPDTIASVQTRYWHQGGKAKPIAPATPRAINTPENTAIIIDGSYGVVDHDNNVNGYQLSSSAAPAKGVISGFNATTGAFTYTPNANANGVDSFVVIVTDADGNATELPVQVTIAAINNAPAGLAVINGLALSVTEGTPSALLVAGTIIGEFAATDPDGDAFTYSLVDSAASRFALSAAGILSIADPSNINFESATSHNIRVRVTDVHGAFSEQDFAVAVQNGNEGNSLPSTYNMEISESAAIGAVVGSVAATDIDTVGVFAQQRYYFWDGSNATATSSDGRYAINATTGQITTNAALNFEAALPSKVYQVIARDNAGNAGYNQTQSSVTIGISDVNEANSLPATYNLAVNENVALGSVVGSVAASDVDGSGTVFAQQRYYFWDGSNATATSGDGRYAINATTGQITTNATLNFEAAQPSKLYQVIARDNAGNAGFNQAVSNVTIGISDVNEANSLPATYNLAINENVAIGTVVGSVAASDIDVSGAFAQQRYYFWDGSNATATSSDGRYAINATTGQITTNAALNFEAALPSKVYQVIARDNAGNAGYNQTQSSVTIGINDLNEAPVSLNWSPLVANVAERDRVATGVTKPAIALGTLSVTDPDTAGLPSATYVYSLADSRFEIIGNTLRLKQDMSFDFEAGSSVSVTVTGTDQTGVPFTIQQAIVIAVSDQDDVLEGTSGADNLSGQQGRDLLYGYAGNDTLQGNAGHDLLDGGDGNDILLGGDGIDRLIGGAGNDRLEGGAGDDNALAQNGVADGGIWGGDGDDEILGGTGIDLTYGEGGNDKFFIEQDGGAIADRHDGGTGSDTISYELFTGTGVTVNLSTSAGLGGEPNARSLYGDIITDVENITGSNLADTINGDAVANTLAGLNGNDILRGLAGDDMLDGGSGDDTLEGGDGADNLIGGIGNDIIYGGAGNDMLVGGDGNDQLYAEAGDDTLDGGAGNDILNGGLNNDTYVVTRSSGADTVYNYDPSGNDIDVIGFANVLGAIEAEDLWFERIGDDLKISVIGTTSSVQVANWYIVTDPASRANHKIDFIIAGVSWSRQVNIEGLATLMATKTKPATTAQRDALMADSGYYSTWTAHWSPNAAPVLEAITNKAVNEDGSLSFSVTATDDVTPNASIGLSAIVVSGGNIVDQATGITFGAANASGVRTMNISPIANASGTVRIRVTAADAGGVTSEQEFDVVVAGVADTPTVTQFTGGAGTAAQAGGIALTLNVSFPDQDGSETQEVWITGVPSGVTLSAGTYDGASATWKLTPAQVPNLKVYTPAGWSQDLSLSVTARATENGQTAISSASSTTVIVNAAPTGASFTGSVNENSVNGTVIGNVVGSDPDAGDTLTYSLVDNAGGRFAVSTSGQLSVANGSLLNFESATSHAFTVRVTDAFGQYKDQVLSVGVNNVNEANAIATSYGFAVNENVGIGTAVGTVAATDLDSSGVAFGQQRYYFWNGSVASAISSDNRYTINATTGQITTNSALDYELGSPSVAYTVIARDNQGNAGYNQVQSSVTIGINDLNEANSLPPSYSFGVAENVGIGTAVGTVVATDPDSSGVAFGQQRYYFWNGSAASSISSDSRYAINATTGQITTNSALDYEVGSPSVAYMIIARDNQGAAGYNQVQSSVTIGIGDINEVNSLPSSYSFAVNENVGTGTVVGSVAAGDLDSSGVAFGQQRYYFWNGSVASAASGDGRYAISATTGQITTNSALDYELGSPSVAYMVIARDNQGNAGYNQTSSTVTIGIGDVNEANSMASSYGFAINENVSFGTVVGSVAAGDFDSSGVAFGQQRYYFWNGSATSATSSDGRYAINEATGQITVNSALNYEAGSPSVAYTVIARDNQGAAGYNQVQSSVTIGINDLNEANSLPSSYPFAVAENVGIGTVVGTVAATDLDSSGVAFGQQRYYFWNGSTASATSSDGRYAINASTGQITTNSALNYEAGSPSVAYTVIARDNQGNAGYNQTSSTITIGINDVNEDHSMSAASFTVNESNTALGPLVPLTTTASAVINVRSSMLSDPEGRNMRWQFDNGSTVNGAWQIEQDGTLRMVQGRDYEEITKVYEWQDQYDYSDPYNPVYLGQAYVWTGARDPNLAIQTLNVRAIDDFTGVIKTAALTLTVADINETPSVSSYASYNSSGGGSVITKGGNEYWVTKDKNGGYIVQLYGADPEGQGVSYSIINSQSPIERIGYYGGNDEIDATAHPYVYLDASNRINFYTPGEGNGDWEGGLKIGGTRRTSSVELNFTVRATDASGLWTDSQFKIIFTRRDTNAPPIVFDLDGDGLELVPYETTTIEFDMDADDILDETGWVAADDGMLALDRNGNGTIDNITEISFISDAPGAQSDLEGLRVYDTDGDGYLDEGDAEYGSFLIWRDANQDGISQSGELKSLIDWGMKSVNLSLTLTGQQPGQGGNVIFGTTEYEKTDGTTGTVGDVFLAFSPSNIDSLAAPVVFDFDGDGAGLVKVANSNVRFDMDGNGTLDRTGWIEADDAYLALDRNANGTIDDIREISFIGDTLGATTDLEGLRSFDTNADGQVSAEDARFAEFKLWFDRNSNGVTDAGELQSLAEAGISGFSLSGQPGDPSNTTERPNIIFNRSVFYRTDGTSGVTLDAGIAFERIGQSGSTEIAYAGWSGEVTDTSSNAVPELPKIKMETRGIDRKAKRHSIEVRDGGLYVADRKAKGTLDARAGIVGGASILSFKDKHVGMLSPVILDLDGDGLDIKSRKKSKAGFDMDGDGIADNTGWVGKGDGMLVIDRNNDGKVTGASEISFLTEKADARSDLEALAVLDSNRDGKLDASDTRFGELKVWTDENQNGVSEDGELKTLAELGITEIGLGGRANSQKAKIGDNVVLATSTFKRTDGSIGTVGDVALAFDPSSKRRNPANSRLDAARHKIDRTERGFNVPTELSIDTLADDTVSDTASNSSATDALVAALKSARHGLTGGSAGFDLAIPKGVDPFDYYADPANKFESVGGETSVSQAQDYRLGRDSMSLEMIDADENAALDAEQPKTGHLRDLGTSLLAIGPDEVMISDSATVAVSSGTDRLLAIIAQDMAAFGVKNGANDNPWRKDNPSRPAEFFA